MLAIAFAVVLVLVPGVYAYLTSIELLSRVDDPLLPDLLLARGQRLLTVLAVTVGLSVPLLHRYTPVVVAGAALATLIGGFPARRTIFGESWSLPAYLVHTFRFWLAMLAPLVILIVIPLATKLGGVALGLFVGAVATLYSAFVARCFPAILRAQPLLRPELAEPFAAVVAKARCPSPRLFEADAAGGTFVNAFALPSLGTPGVLFTSGLLRSLDTREATAIFAHEIAHLEHHDRRHLLKALASMAVLVGLPIFLIAGPYGSVVEPYTWLWPILVIVSFVFRMRAHRSHETESDLRGAELSGDPEALISGLTKLHTLMRVPRRWSAQHESWSTHPSLSRRIQAIRRAHADEAPLLEPTTFFAADGSRRAVVLDSERVHLLRGIDADATEAGDPLAVAAERRSVAYPSLRDLRLEATTNDLVVVERGGATTRLRITTDDASRLTALLDHVDVRLDYGAASSSASAQGRLPSLLVAIASLTAVASLPLALLGILAAALPSIPTLASAGVGGLVGALFGWSRLASSPLDAAFLAAVSLVCLGTAARRRLRKTDDEPRRALPLAALVPATLALIGITWALTRFPSSLPVMTLHLWARDAVGTAACLAACSAALLVSRARRTRLLSVLPALVGALVTALGLVRVGRDFGEDLFAALPAEASESTATIVASRTVALPQTIVDLSLSPRGKHFFARIGGDESYDDPTGPGSFLVETETGLETVEALALDFVDDRTIASVVREGQDSLLRLPDRSIVLPSLVAVQLVVDPIAAAWHVRGFDPDVYDTIVIRGALDSDQFETARFVMPEEDSAVVDAVSLDGWAVSYGYAVPEPAPLLLALGLGVSTRPVVATELAVRRPDEAPVEVGVSLLYPSCYDAGGEEALFVCVASYAKRTNLFTLEPSTRALAPLASVSGEYSLEPVRRGRFLLARWHDSPLLVDLATKRFIRVGEPANFHPWEIVAWRGQTLANARRSGDGTSEVAFYRLDADGLVH